MKWFENIKRFVVREWFLFIMVGVLSLLILLFQIL